MLIYNLLPDHELLLALPPKELDWYSMSIDGLDAGNVALRKLVTDELIGSRAAAKDEDAPPVR
jgi:hypothetical protein